MTSASLLAHFSCAAGFQLDAARLPTVVALIETLKRAEAQQSLVLKRYWFRARPFIGNSAPVCIARTPAVARSSSYPSGHATVGYSTALLLSALLPERAAFFQQRGRVIAESRVICGVHWDSDIRASYIVAAADTVAFLGAPGTQGVMRRATTELKKAKRKGVAPNAAACAEERLAAVKAPSRQTTRRYSEWVKPATQDPTLSTAPH